MLKVFPREESMKALSARTVIVVLAIGLVLAVIVFAVNAARREIVNACRR